MPELREMPSSLNDACRKLDEAYAEIDQLKCELAVVAGHHPLAAGLTFDGDYKLLAESAATMAILALGIPHPFNDRDGFNAALRAYQQKAQEPKDA